MNKITKANFKKLVLVLTLTLVMTLGMSIFFRLQSMMG